MEGLLDDLVSSLAHHVQTAPQKLQAVASAATTAATLHTALHNNSSNSNRTGGGKAAGSSSSSSSTPLQLFWNQTVQQPPKSLDLVYITDRIIASSEPALAPFPTFNDHGRDEERKLSSSVMMAAAQRRTIITPANLLQNQQSSSPLSPSSPPLYRQGVSGVSTLSAGSVSSQTMEDRPDPEDVSERDKNNDHRPAEGQDRNEESSTRDQVVVVAIGYNNDGLRRLSSENPQEGGEASVSEASTSELPENNTAEDESNQPQQQQQQQQLLQEGNDSSQSAGVDCSSPAADTPTNNTNTNNNEMVISTGDHNIITIESTSERESDSNGNETNNNDLQQPPTNNETLESKEYSSSSLPPPPQQQQHDSDANGVGNATTITTATTTTTTDATIPRLDGNDGDSHPEEHTNNKGVTNDLKQTSESIASESKQTSSPASLQNNNNDASAGHDNIVVNDDEGGTNTTGAGASIDADTTTTTSEPHPVESKQGAAPPALDKISGYKNVGEGETDTVTATVSKPQHSDDAILDITTSASGSQQINVSLDNMGGLLATEEEDDDDDVENNEGEAISTIHTSPDSDGAAATEDDHNKSQGTEIDATSNSGTESQQIKNSLDSIDGLLRDDDGDDADHKNMEGTTKPIASESSDRAPSSDGRFSPISEIDSDLGGESDVDPTPLGTTMLQEENHQEETSYKGILNDESSKPTIHKEPIPTLDESNPSNDRSSSEPQNVKVDPVLESGSKVTVKSGLVSSEQVEEGGEADLDQPAAGSVDRSTVEGEQDKHQPKSAERPIDSKHDTSPEASAFSSTLMSPKGQQQQLPDSLTGPAQLAAPTTCSSPEVTTKPQSPIETGPQALATKVNGEHVSSPLSTQKANESEENTNTISATGDKSDSVDHDSTGQSTGTQSASDVGTSYDSRLFDENTSDSASFPASTELHSIDESFAEEGESSVGPPTSEPAQDHPAPAPGVKNSPATIASYLERRHGKDHYLGYSLSDRAPDDRTLVLLRRQIVQLGWWSPCVERSETPSIPKLLKICYALHAYLQLDTGNVVWVYCANGKTRTAIAIACYLKFAGLVDHSSEGFLHFLSQRGVPNPEGTLQQLPPSLHTFFQQFDSVLDLGGFLNRKPLLLRAITLQGIPVEDKPCLDIWDNTQRHIYSSHPEMWQQHERENGAFLRPSENNNNKITSQWADEEGFYRVNVVLDGDFLLLCRFGGDFAEETTIHDPSKILFRYANTTGFLSGGCPYELPPNKVDLMRRYAHSLDDDEFLVTLLFEAHWDGGLTSDEHIPVDVARRLASPSKALPSSGDGVWRSHERGSCEEGWKVIVEHHSARPRLSDVEGFRTFHGQNKALLGCNDHLISLALQLTNFNYNQAAPLLVDISSPLGWWQQQHPQADLAISDENNFPERSLQLPHEKGSTAVDDEETQQILDILDHFDVESHLETPDLKPFVHDDANAIVLKNWVDVEQNRDARAMDKLPVTPKQRGGRSWRSGDNEEQQRSPHYSQDVASSACLRDSGWMVPSMMYPQQGDVMRAFGPYYQQLHSASVPPGALETSGATSLASSRPIMPMFPHGRRSFLPPPLPSKGRKRDEYDADIFPVPSYDARHNASDELLQELRHTGVNMDGLRKLARASQQWGLGPVPVQEDPVEETTEAVEDERHIISTDSMDSKLGSMNREAKEQQEKKWEDAKKTEAKEKEEKKKVEDEKRKKLETEGVGEEKKKEDGEAKRDEKEAGEPASGDDLPLKDHPDYAKYFKMLKMGMAKEQVLHALQRDSKDPLILDLDPNKSLKSQVPDDEGGNKGEVALKDDPEYSKYFKMLSMGLPIGAVKNALTKDGKDPAVMDLDSNKSLKSQMSKGDSDDGPPLKDDPEYAKYYKMLSMGLPIGAVKNALTKDGKDPAVMDLDPSKSFKSQMRKGDLDNGPPLKDDPEYAKYFKMLTMGLPMGAVKNAIGRDGKDPAVMDLDPSKSLKSQMGGGDADDGPPLKEDPEFAKYFKMLTMGLPVGAVKNAIARDGKDPAVMDLDPTKSLKSQTGGGAEEKDSGIPLKDDPEYSKYFKMMGMGLPMGAVKNALERDGKDPAVMDLDHNKSVAFQMKKRGSASKKAAKKKKRVRRKKIYWNPIDPGKLKEDSMWSIVRDSIRMDKLNYDVKEFEELFTESADPADKKKQGGTKKKEEKKATQVIDGKRDMNGGIILTRLRTENEKIAEFVDKMENGKFDATQLKALKEYLPNADERRGLMAHMQKGAASEEAREKALADLSKTERYMVKMMEVSDADAKFDAMLFRTVFKTRFDDVTTAIRNLNTACDEVRSSERLRKLMAMILTVVNQINTGGEGNMALGFTLDALLKLNEAKAFDKKTSVLHYLVKLLKKNDDSLLHFDSDLVHVNEAENVMLDALNVDVNAITEELTDVKTTVSAEAQRLEDAGELKPMTLADMKEQRSSVKHVGAVPQYNKIEHHTGRTSMERFVLNAEVAADGAAQSIEDVRKKFQTLLAYFGEDPQMSTSDFFGTLRRFVAEFKKASEQVEVIEKAAAKEKKRAAAKAAKEAKKAGKATNSGATKSAKGTAPLAGGGGGIAAMVAAAAANASKKKSSAKKSSSVGKAGPPAGGIAAMAAAAAAKKNKKSAEAAADVVASQSGGIAAMAAAAAARKNMQGFEADKRGNTSQPAEPAETNNKAGEGSTDRVPNQSGGIAAMAAAAAARKNKKPFDAGKTGNTSQPDEFAKGEPSTDEVPSQSGGIAAMAAAAAERKNKQALEAGRSRDSSQPKQVAAVAAKAQRKDAPDKPASEKNIDESKNALTSVAADAVENEKHEQAGESKKSYAGKDDFRKKSDAPGAAAGSEFQSSQSEIKAANNDTKPAALESTAHISEFNRTPEINSDNNENGEPTSTEARSASEETAANSAFAAKAAAYRKRKGKKDDKDIAGKERPKPTSSAPVSVLNAASQSQKESQDVSNRNDDKPTDIPTAKDDKAESAEDGKSNFLASAAAYRRKKSKRDLFDDDDRKDPSIFTVSFTRNEAATLQTAKSFPDESSSEISAAPPMALPEEGTQDSLRPGRSFDSFFMPGDEDLPVKDSPYTPVLRDFDDSSVALIDEKRPIDARMSETWEKGDTIPNWMSWANQVIRTSDTDSVVGFEESMDLREDFDDDSTVATFMDDSTIMSYTPARGDSSVLFGDEDDDIPATTPAKVAASILFTDSPVGSLDGTPSHSNVRRQADDLGLDAGLAFGIQEVGLDAGLSFGGTDDFGGLGMEDFMGMNSQDEDKSPEKRSWFKWGDRGR